MRRTKIVCTIGPSSDSPEIVRGLIRSGMDVARLNFSHGTHETHEQNHNIIRAAADELGENVAVLIDLQGPKIRTGPLENHEPVTLLDNAKICVTTRDVPGDADEISTTYDHLPDDVKEGDPIMIADGTLELRVERASPPDVLCTVVRGGLLGEHKGINLPGVAVSAPSLTEKDVQDLEFGLSLDVDYVALSFVRTPDDVRALKGRIAKAGHETPVIAKIERPEALECFDEILELVDGVMVARGDLGVEVEFDKVPQIQKDLIRKCNRRGIPVITATQMLESMMNNTRPTRAEVTDVANAIYDGTDAVMLSGETAAGRYPLQAVDVMAKVARRADQATASSLRDDRWARKRERDVEHDDFAEAVGQAAYRIAESLNVTRIVCFTQSGYTARAIARCRPCTPITAITLSEEARRRCALFWGVDAIRAVEVHSTDEMVQAVDAILLEANLAKPGDIIIITAGTPLAVGGRTNILKLHTVGDRG